MPEPKQNIKLNAGHYIAIGTIVLGILSTWFGITSHIKDDDIHLTEQQRSALIKFTAITEEKLPTIKTNEDRIIVLEKEFAVFTTNFENLYLEHESLEGKVSRNYVEIRNKIEDGN
jgi:hypothetical protein